MDYKALLLLSNSSELSGKEIEQAYDWKVIDYRDITFHYVALYDP